MRNPLQIVHVGYNENGKTPVIVPSAGSQLHIYSVKCQNGTAGALDVGILKRLSTSDLAVYQIDASATPDAVACDLLSGTATDIFTATNNDGFLVQSNYRFGLIGLNVSDAASGGVFEYTYWNGTAYATLTTLAVPSDYNSTGTKLIVFQPPIDWVPGTHADVGGTANLYSIRIRATTAPGDVVTANQIWVAQPLVMALGVAAKGVASFEAFSKQPLVLSGSEAILPYFSGSASAANSVSAIYAVQD